MFLKASDAGDLVRRAECVPCAEAGRAIGPAPGTERAIEGRKARLGSGSAEALERAQGPTISYLRAGCLPGLLAPLLRPRSAHPARPVCPREPTICARDAVSPAMTCGQRQRWADSVLLSFCTCQISRAHFQVSYGIPYKEALLLRAKCMGAHVKNMCNSSAHVCLQDLHLLSVQRP